MFIYLADTKKVTQALNSLSTAQMTLAAANINTLNSLLTTDVSKLLANRKHHGVLILEQDNLNAANITNSEKQAAKEITLQNLLLNRAALIHEINALCLSEAILVRDTLINALDTLSCDEVSYVANISKVLASPAQAQNTKEDVTAKIATTNNVTPIQLVEVKQRLSQALQTDKQKSLEIKNKLNSLLSAQTTDKALTQSGKNTPVTKLHLQA